MGQFKRYHIIKNFKKSFKLNILIEREIALVYMIIILKVRNINVKYETMSIFIHICYLNEPFVEGNTNGNNVERNGVG
jgi:hypothetical protein